VRVERDDLLTNDGWWLVHAHHPRKVRPVNVGVHQTDALSLFRERNGEIHRDRRLADTALSG
jgi:hypothetical protein